MGYVAGTSERSGTALAAPPPDDPGTVAAMEGRSSCSPEESGRGAVLMPAGRDEAASAEAAQAGKKPNILVIFGDDIGITNISAYSDGLMGYETPNIDRIAKEGIRFLHYYGEQSCTAGRAAFLTGQHGLRTGLTKVGFPVRADGHEPARPLHRRAAQEPRLRHRAVRQEPRRRPQRIAADRQRFRRVLRQPLSPERRGRARAARLSEGPGLPRQVRPPRRAQVQGQRHG